MELSRAELKLLEILIRRQRYLVRTERVGLAHRLENKIIDAEKNSIDRISHEETSEILEFFVD